MPVWTAMETYKRLLTALVAANDNKINISEVARLYGEDMTYDALENQLRKIKKDALVLKDEASGREGPAIPVRPKGKKVVAATTKKDAIKTGRVVKKKAAPRKVKAEPVVVEDIDVEQAYNSIEEYEEYA